MKKRKEQKLKSVIGKKKAMLLVKGWWQKVKKAEIISEKHKGTSHLSNEDFTRRSMPWDNSTRRKTSNEALLKQSNNFYEAKSGWYNSKRKYGLDCVFALRVWLTLGCNQRD